MRSIILAAAILVLAPAFAAAQLQPAQFWAPPKAPGDQRQPDIVPGETTRAPPPSGPASGRAGSLGGSGATGPDSVGTQPERDTDFDRKTWRDTSFDVVLRLMSALPRQFDSAAQHELARNLLVSIADAPAGDDGGSRLLAARVRELLAMGNIEDAAALARAAPGLPTDPGLAHDEVEAELLAGQIEAACIDLHAFAEILTDPVSANALLLCRQRAGEIPVDPVETEVPPIDVASLGAAARIAGAPLVIDPATASPAQRVAIARDAGAAPAQRLEAAYGAGRASAMTGEALGGIFRGVPAVGGLDASGGPPETGDAAAALYRAIAQEGDTGQKVTLAERGLLSPAGTADKIGVAMTESLRNLQPVPELGTLAARLAILFYTEGDIEAATPWGELATEAGGGAALWPYRVILKQADPIGIADWEQQAGLDRAHAARILTILSAFGVTAPPANTPIAGDHQPEPNFADLLAIDRAAANGHVGETTLRALTLLGTGGPAHAHPLALKRALADLDMALLHTEAHALAFEAITATLRGF